MGALIRRFEFRPPGHGFLAGMGTNQCPHRVPRAELCLGITGSEKASPAALEPASPREDGTASKLPLNSRPQGGAGGSAKCTAEMVPRPGCVAGGPGCMSDEAFGYIYPGSISVGSSTNAIIYDVIFCQKETANLAPAPSAGGGAGV